MPRPPPGARSPASAGPVEGRSGRPYQSPCSAAQEARSVAAAPPSNGPATTAAPRHGPPVTGRIGPVTTRRLVTLHVWGVPGRAVPAALLRMGTDRRLLRRIPGLRFSKLLA